MRPPLISLLCLPCAGASATMYLRWRRLLPEWVRVVAVELPGRGGRFVEGFARDYDTLVAQLCDEQAAELRGPCALFGHSMGALLAYGMVQRQRALGRPLPQQLFVSGSAAPSLRDPSRFEGKEDDASLLADLRKQGGTPEEVYAHPELMRLVFDTLRADYAVCASFRDTSPEPLPIPLHVLAGRADDIAQERIQAWQREAGGTHTLDLFDGGHFFIRQQEGEVLAALVRHLMQRHAVTGPAAAASPVGN